MTTSPKKAKPTITAPKIATAWLKVCETSGKAETTVIASIESLSAVLVLESGLSVADMKTVIKNTGKESAFIKVSHVPALATWSKLRALHADFRALPIAKQLSTAMASYDILGAGKGEQIKSVDALTKEIARERKEKVTKQAENKGTKGKESKAPKNTLKEILAFITALDFVNVSEADEALIAEIHATLEYKMINA